MNFTIVSLLVALKIKKHWLTKGKEVNSDIETSPF